MDDPGAGRPRRGLHFWSGGATSLGVQAVWNTFNSFTLTGIPLFILLGELLVASGLARGVYRAMSPVRRRGLPAMCPRVDKGIRD